MEGECAVSPDYRLREIVVFPAIIVLIRFENESAQG